MGIFDFLRKDRVVDLSASYNAKKEARAAEKPSPQTANSPPAQPSGMFGIFDGGKAQDSAESNNPNETVEERRKKLAKRLVNIMERLDILSTQIYHLQQRVELIEKKMNINP